MRGGIFFEVSGERSGQKADKFAEALRPLLELKKVRVTCPVNLVEMRVTGLDDSITPDEMRQAIAGGCPAGGGIGR